MYAFSIKIGNIVAAVKGSFKYVKHICSPFLTQEASKLTVVIDNDTIIKERELYARESEKVGAVLPYLPDWFMESQALLRKLMDVLPKFDMLFMHGSAISYNNKAYIFTAPSGTGKSTHTSLWKEHFGDLVTVINDDKPFLQFIDNDIYVCGTPWQGKHDLGENISVKLFGICILAQGHENCIKPLQPTDALRYIIKQSDIPKDADCAMQALSLVDKLLQTVPVYYMECTPTQEAVSLCHKTIVK